MPEPMSNTRIPGASPAARKNFSVNGHRIRLQHQALILMNGLPEDVVGGGWVAHVRTIEALTLSRFLLNLAAGLEAYLTPDVWHLTDIVADARHVRFQG